MAGGITNVKVKIDLITPKPGSSESMRRAMPIPKTNWIIKHTKV